MLRVDVLERCWIELLVDMGLVWRVWSGIVSYLCI